MPRFCLRYGSSMVQWAPVRTTLKSFMVLYFASDELRSLNAWYIIGDERNKKTDAFHVKCFCVIYSASAVIIDLCKSRAYVYLGTHVYECISFKSLLSNVRWDQIIFLCLRVLPSCLVLVFMFWLLPKKLIVTFYCFIMLNISSFFTTLWSIGTHYPYSLLVLLNSSQCTL